MAYHCTLESTKSNGNIGILPLSVCDEALDLFRANVLFKNFEVKNNSDRTLMYCLLFISECLGKIQNKQRDEASKILYTHALTFSTPGEPHFPLNAIFQCKDIDGLKVYLQSLRQDLSQKLVERVYSQNPKWWLSFSKRKFMNKSL